MEDKQIVALYLARSETAIRETERKYGGMLTQLAMGILGDEEDTKECLNDAYLAILPGVAIMLLVLAFMLFGNALRDSLDVKK